MTESQVQLAWDRYQAAAAQDPYSHKTKTALAAYRRALTMAAKKKREAEA